MKLQGFQGLLSAPFNWHGVGLRHASGLQMSREMARQKQKEEEAEKEGRGKRLLIRQGCTNLCRATFMVIDNATLAPKWARDLSSAMNAESHLVKDKNKNKQLLQQTGTGQAKQTIFVAFTISVILFFLC